MAPAASSKAGPVVIYGASGYTGKLIAAELAGRGADFTIAGRSRDKLEAVAASLPSPPPVAAVSLDDASGLRSLLEPAATVIGCAGPFTLHGRPLIEAAAATGTNYLDTTGEQPFIHASFEIHDAAAKASGAALASGMGFDYAPGDMLAARTAAGLGPLRDLTVAYTIRGFGPTRGTALSALEMMSGGDLEWRDGAHRTAARHVGEGEFDFPSPIGSRRVGRYPAGETITVPRHVDTARMRTVIDVRSLIGLPLGPLAAPTMTLSGLALRGPVRSGLSRLIDRMPEGPSERSRKAVRFTLVCDVDRSRRPQAPRRPPRQRHLRHHRDDHRRGRAADVGHRLRPQRSARAGAGVRSRIVPRGARAVRDVRRLRGTGVNDDLVHYPCPACGSQLFGWTAAHDPLHHGRKIVVDRCETCRLAVTRDDAAPDATAEIDAAITAEDRGSIEIEAANGASVQCSLGGAQWAGLEPELRRLHLSPDSVRRLLAQRGVEVVDVVTPYSRRSYTQMRQTLINAFTYRDNFLENAREGRLPKPVTTRDRLLRRLDYLVSWLVWVPCAVFAYPLERGAARLGRGGILVARGKTGESGPAPA